MRRKKALKYSIAFIALLSIGLYYLIIHVLPYNIISPYRAQKIHTVNLNAYHSETVTINSSEGFKLKGYHITPLDRNPKATIILVHGIGSNKEYHLGLAESLANIGFASVLFDNRAHGESEGTYCTYGFFEKNDISKIVDYIQTKNTLPIGIWGNSLGGAIAIQALAKDKRLAFGIIESTFTSLQQIVYDYQTRHAKGISLPWVCDISLREAGSIAGFPPQKVKPIEAVKHINQPVIIAHGDADKNIAFDYGKALFNHLASQKKKFITIKGADHYNVSRIGGKDYFNNIINFINQHI